jgi:hypothetical protein|tara:strand:+ start:492 stop:722 length:231 start_codon:yes stop_codon:yes gene_type:complete
MIWALSIMLWYHDVPTQDIQYWQHQTFESQYECHDYLAKNKVVIVDSVLETFRNKDGKLLQNFEFYCESKSYVMEV